MSVNLTPGALQALASGKELKHTVLQLLKIRSVTTSGVPRFRLMMSDGRHSFSSFLLATQLNHLAEENLLEPNCVCRMKKTIPTVLSDGRLVLTVHDMEILQSAEEAGSIIGDPTPYNKDSNTSKMQSPDSSICDSEMPPPDEAPGCSDRNNIRFKGKSTMKVSPMSASALKASKMEDSPVKASPSTFSPMKASSSKFSPKKSSPSTFSPMKASPSTFSPMKASPSKFSPMKASPSTFSPMKASPSKFSPMKASPSKFSPMKASPSTFSPMKASPSASPMKGTSSSPESSTKVIPISSLNPYQTKWTIRARVTNKSSIRNWSNSKGEGKLFSFETVDESGEIKITAFNKEVDKFYSLLEQGKVYYITKATLKVANKQYSSLKNDYEMTLNANSSIVPCDNSQGIPAVHCDFVPIAELENRDNNDIIDVIGVCKSAEDVSRITTKNSREVSKRALNLIDRTGKVVTATLWGEEAEKFDSSGQPVVAIKGARLSDFGGRSLSALFSSTVMVNPDIPEAFMLRGWFDQQGHALSSQSLTVTRSSGRGPSWKFLCDVKDEQLGHREKADYFSCVATVIHIRKENCLYKACPSADCNKKVIKEQNGFYHCEKCRREFPDFKYRLLLSANLADFRDNQWVTCFQETAEVLLGQSAESLGQLRDTDEVAFDEVFQRANFTTHIFKNRVKLETYNDEVRVKVTVLEVHPVDHLEYSRRLLTNIRELSGKAE